MSFQRIIIADDSETARMIIRRCLEILGLRDCQFIEAKDGEEALTVLKTVKADALFTDLSMPIMDGSALLKAVKVNPNLASLPVVVVSSASSPVKDRQLFDLGAFAILKKPVSPACMSEVVEMLKAKQRESASQPSNAGT